MQYESERIEYKSQMIDDIYKEVIAFANTDGGVIYLGIDDKGNQIGIDNVDETYTRLTNGIRDAIAPDVTMFVRYVLQDNKVIRIEVGEGSYKLLSEIQRHEAHRRLCSSGHIQRSGISRTDSPDDKRIRRRYLRRFPQFGTGTDL